MCTYNNKKIDILISYLVLSFDDAHFDVILRRVPDQPTLLRQVCQTEVVDHIPETNNITITKT